VVIADRTLSDWAALSPTALGGCGGRRELESPFVSKYVARNAITVRPISPSTRNTEGDGDVSMPVEGFRGGAVDSWGFLRGAIVQVSDQELA
jgi:hypothetical protein